MFQWSLLFALLVLRVRPEQASAPLTAIHRAGYCSSYGECGKNPEVTGGLFSSNVPCLSNTPARRVSGSHLALLASVCPMLVAAAEEEGATSSCCSEAQLRTLKASLALSQSILSRCPACAENFASLHCHNVCSPDQSLFINVTRAFKRTDATNSSSEAPLAVLEYQSFYRQPFAEALFDSCKGVRLPATGGFAIATMCGLYGASLCDAQRWLDYQGDTSNGLAPLAIDFQLVPPGSAPLDGGLEPLDARVWKCSEAVGNGTGEPCSCPDCPLACPVSLPPQQAPGPFRLGNADGAAVLCALLFCLLVALFGLFLVWQSSRARRKQRPGPQAARPSCAHRSSRATHRALGLAFCWWGRLVASYPLAVLLLSAVTVIALANGLLLIQLTTDPVELWSAPDSRARLEKAFYDEQFGPFFRTNQVFLAAKALPGYTYDSVLLGRQNFSGVLALPVLLDLLALQSRLRDVRVWSEKHRQNVSLQDVCYAPLNPDSPSLADCAVNSLVQYFQSNATRLEMTASQVMGGRNGTVGWHDHFLYCSNSPLSFQDITSLEMSCMADYGGPVFPFLAVGGYSGEAYTEAEALILTISLNNFNSSDPRYAFALLWEEQFLKIVQEFQQEHKERYEVTYMAECSLEDEINRTTWEDLPIFAISFLVIFAYIVFALGEYSGCKRSLVNSKVTLGLGGILVVLGAVMASMGFCAFVGLSSSLIILEVVPFLVLAVGADNIFIFILEYQQSEPLPGETIEQHIGRVLGEVAPSMLLCSVSEIICFSLGALSPMPAIRTFALNTTVALLFDFLLQMSAFVALVALDSRRQKASRCDLCCCIRLKVGGPEKAREGLLGTFMRRYYAPFLLSSPVRILVVLLFTFMFCGSLFLMVNVPVGLEQELSVPGDSYMLQYFQSLSQYLMVGPPVYFVTTGGYNFSTVPGMNGVCSSSGCDDNSLTQKIQYATQFPEQSFLAIPASSWVDDFIDWLSPLSSCCRTYTSDPHKGEFCPSTDSSSACLFGQCMLMSSGPLRPDQDQFHRFLPWFLSDRPNLKCAKGGLGAYDTAVKLGPGGEIEASRFMAYHQPLKNSAEYTAALKAARELAANITATMRQVPGTDPDFQVFPYTITYVFYEQYLDIAFVGFFNVAVCLMPTFIVSCILLGMDLRSGFINLVTIIMIVVDTVGAMTLWGISFNALSLVNLVSAVGLSVEFVSHITRSFAVNEGPNKLARAKEATIRMGSAVFSGVAMTNLPGIVVLAFAKAQLVQIFFFRLNLIITLLGTLHGLILLPVLLSYFGPDFRQPTKLPEESQPRKGSLATIQSPPAIRGGQESPVYE